MELAKGDLPDSAAAESGQTSPIKPLTDREMEILQHLPTRLSTVEIGQTLDISPNTVKTHLRNIYRKLGVRSRNKAVIQAVRYKLVSPDSEWLVRR
jgi:LuxR family transcriptional regulator, maltose regulon positive regulatory protein